jgi:hypothetical protein
MNMIWWGFLAVREGGDYMYIVLVDDTHEPFCSRIITKICVLFQRERYIHVFIFYFKNTHTYSIEVVADFMGYLKIQFQRV